MDIKIEIETLVKETMEEVISIRHHIHKNPELSFEEHNTSKYVKDILTKHGIGFTDNWVKTGIVATVQGDLPGDVIAFRSELDALPIKEENNASYASANEGVMHACGHDVHTSCMLGCAIILSKLRHRLSGTVHFIFQPGEELIPGGASLMIKEGILDQYKPSYIVAQHVYTDLEVGKVGICGGSYMASADEIYFTIHGDGGHGALPHTTSDAIVCAAQMITALQTIVSRNSNPITPSVLTIGKINSEGGATNIIPKTVRMEGTFRTFDEAWRAEAHTKIQHIVRATAEAFGVKVELEIRKGYPSLFNDRLLAEKIKSKMISYIGEEQVVDLPKRMTSEDFSYFSKHVPVCFYRLGVRNEERGITHGVHTSRFDVDEEALRVGTGLFCYLAMEGVGI